MIAWYIGVVGIFVGIAGGAYFAKSLTRMSGDLKWSISNLVIASFIYVIYSSIMITLGVLQYDISADIWQLVPILFLISTIFYVVGSKQLIELLVRIPEKKTRKSKRY